LPISLRHLLILALHPTEIIPAHHPNREHTHTISIGTMALQYQTNQTMQLEAILLIPRTSRHYSWFWSPYRQVAWIPELELSLLFCCSITLNAAVVRNGILSLIMHYVLITSYYTIIVITLFAKNRNIITKYIIEIQMAGHQKNIKFIKLAPILYKLWIVNTT